MPVFTDYPTTKQTSLSDLLGNISNLQQFQQQQQLMPLQLEKAQLELQKARATNPLEIERSQLETKKLRETTDPEIARVKALAEKETGTVGSAITQAEELAKQAKIQTKVSELSYGKNYNEALNQIIGGYRNDPRLMSNNPLEVAKVIKEAEDHAKYVTREDPDGVIKTEMKFAPIKALAATGQHGAVKDVFNNIIQSGISPTSQQALQTPQLTTLGGAPAVFTPATGTAQPLGMAGPQQTNPLPQGLLQGMPQGVSPTQMGLQYPIRRAGDIRPFAPNEETDTAQGAAYRNALTSRQLEMATSRRNLDEVIKQAGQIEKEDLFTSGALGAAERSIKGFLGDPKYKQLSKDLANVQIANMKAQGGSMDTVAGQHLQKLANGDETYPPEILKNIARRTYADIENLDMQATGAAKFAQKYGDNNLNAFKRMWTSNADSKVFEAISIFNNVTNPQERKKAIDNLFGSNPKEREVYFRKYNNIKKLTETGEL